MSVAKQLQKPDYQLKGFSFYSKIAPPVNYATHQHPEVEIALVLNQASASVQWGAEADQNRCPILPKQLCIIPSGQSHAVGWQQAAEYIIMFIHPALFLKTAQDSISAHSLDTIGSYGVKDSLIVSLAIALRTSFQAEGIIEHLYIDTLINTLILYLLKTYAGCNFTEVSSQPIIYQRWLKDVLEYIHESIDQDLRLAKLAEVAKMSESSFCHLFKDYMNISPHQYVISERIARAKQLLLKQDMSIAEVALACGFNSQSHLTLYFRQQTGITPKAYQLTF